MARFHPRGLVTAVLVLVLLLGAAPSLAATGATSYMASPPKASLKGEVVRIFKLVLGYVSPKTEESAPNGGSGAPPPSTPGGASPDIGSSLDPLG